MHVGRQYVNSMISFRLPSHPSVRGIPPNERAFHPECIISSHLFDHSIPNYIIPSQKIHLHYKYVRSHSWYPYLFVGGYNPFIHHSVLPQYIYLFIFSIQPHRRIILWVPWWEGESERVIRTRMTLHYYFSNAVLPLDRDPSS